jgi:hypothetical protein
MYETWLLQNIAGPAWGIFSVASHVRLVIAFIMGINIPAPNR